MRLWFLVDYLESASQRILFWRNTLVIWTQVMTLHCKTKTKNINLFLSKDQLLSEAAADSYTGEICYVLKRGPNL